MSKRLVPVAAARLRHETNLKITLLAKAERLAAELREHMQSDVPGGADETDSLDTAIDELLFQIEHSHVKREQPEAPAE